MHGLDEGRRHAHYVLPSPDNRSVSIPYVKEANALHHYAFDPATGGLAALEPKDVGPPAGSGPRHIAYHPRLSLVYFSEEPGFGVSIYRRAEDGGLSLWQRARAVPADKIPWGMAVSPDGRFLSVTGFQSATLGLYSVAADGSLVRAATLPWDERIADLVAR